MSNEIPEKCPKCGCGIKDTAKDWVMFTCGSQLHSDGSRFGPGQSVQCVCNQRDLLARRVAELEAELAARPAHFGNFPQGIPGNGDPDA